ncbi:MAG TPA: T9SS type A sorting domain-containing protein [Bacteroidetes bacterium]|nr:hypothetical protein BMS3Bbin04_01620 [bacterium BMS3Bbin04]HDO66027.1 T9SS type A sorting domain-containing protein [Bacteroidota bacterium]HEX05152.1 T9SS type A sorting domain-containing protein [Bacteroidota bacterium]
MNISLDPLFVDPDNGNYHLQEGSPCIDAGDPDSPLDPDSTVADIGAFYFHHDVGVLEQRLTDIPSSWSLLPPYPNPFNPTTTISVSLPRPSDLNVSVFNVKGQQVADLTNASFGVGTHQFTFDASGMASGLYFVAATVPGQMDQVQKVMFVR